MHTYNCRLTIQQQLLTLTSKGGKPMCNHITRTMWAWAIERNLYLSASFLPCALNTTAYATSSQFHDNMEWLQHLVFQMLTDIWGEPDIDLFASRLNHQVSKFAAWQPCPDAFAIDAFSLSWEEACVTFSSHFVYWAGSSAK